MEDSMSTPAKRRKFFRRRAEDDGILNGVEGKDELDSSLQQEATSNEVTSTAAGTYDGTELDNTGFVNMVHLRKLQRARKGGIEFTATSRSTPSDSRNTVPASKAHTDGRLSGVSERFTGHTGQKVDVDKHMMAYVDAEMAKRRHEVPSSGATKPNSSSPEKVADHSLSEIALPQRQPATLGKLHEIDLGPDSKLRNIARTEAATQSIMKGDSNSLDPDDYEASLEVQPGKNNKTTRNRRRRNSEDMMRDRLVEEVLRESKLDVYEEPQESRPVDDQAADDRIADQFRKDFLDAIHSRRRGNRAKNNKVTKSDVPRGPKLGGSRSARAAMREKQGMAQK